MPPGSRRAGMLSVESRMGASGWMAVSGALALLIVAGGWWYRRAWLSDAVVPSDRKADETPQAWNSEPESIEQAHIVKAPDARALLRQLYGLAFDAADAAAATPAAEHEVIASACTNLLSRVEFQARHMPRRPQLLPKLMQAINDPDASMERIVSIIGEDPALSVNLLRIANSPYYRVQSKPVEHLMRAANLLGLDGLRPVIAAALVQPVMRTGEGAFGRLPVLIWEHTRMAGDVASALARGGSGQEDAFAAQMLGLLHGLGAIVVTQVLRDNYALYPQLSPDVDTVARVLDALAAPMAHRIATTWELSERIGAALEAQAQDALPADPLARALYAGRTAATLAMLCRQGQVDPDEGLALLVAWADARGLDADWERHWERLLA